MEENKLSEELRHCLEGNGCVDCSCYEPKSVLTCRGLLQKAYETVKEHEEIYEIMRPLAERLNEFTALEEQGKLPCEIGHRVYMIYQFLGKGAWEIEEHKIKTVIDCLQQEIDVLKEFKKRLIADVVTGKIDVRGIEIPEYDLVEEDSDGESEENTESMEGEMDEE